MKKNTKAIPKPELTPQSPVKILWFHGFVGERMKECDLIDTLESLVEAVKEHPDAKHRYVANVNVADLGVCMFDRLDYWVVYQQTGSVKPRVADFRNAIRAYCVEQDG